MISVGLLGRKTSAQSKDPFWKGDKTVLTGLLPLKVYPFPLKHYLEHYVVVSGDISETKISMTLPEH